MSDIVERLRRDAETFEDCPVGDVLTEAADEIERLRATIESVSVCRDHTWEITAFDGCLVCENKRLRKECERLETELANERKNTWI